MSVATFNRYGSKFFDEVDDYLSNKEITKDNIFYRIKRNYNTISKLNEYTKKEEYVQYISQNIVKNRKIRNGYPVIKGTRITPDDVFSLAVKNEFDVQKVLEEYPSLTDERQVIFGILYWLDQKIKNPIIWMLWILGK